MTDVTPRTTGAFVRHWAAHRPGHPALRWAGGELTYAELDMRSSRVASALRAEGVGPGRRVAYLDKNSPEQFELFFGAAKLNAVPCPVNYRLAAPEIADIVRDSEATVFAVGEEFLPTVETLDIGARIVVIEAPGSDGAESRDGAGSGGGARRWPAFAEWRDAHEAVDPMAPQEPGDVAFQLYSSGTTGRPKGVQLTQGNLASGMVIYPEISGFGPDAVSVVAMPLYHIGGSGWALAGFSVGATNVLVREIVPPALVSLLETERVTHGFLVPAVLQFLLAVPGVEDRDYSALRCMLYGASPISDRVLADSIRTFGCDFVQLYGLTESTGTVVFVPATDHDPGGPNSHRLRGIGKPVPGTEARVVDPVTGVDVPDGEVGEIWIKGPTVMLGYWHLPDLTAETVRDGGWLRTGDAAYRDADGYMYVHDRVKDMIVSGGENIYPAELENAIMSLPGVSDVAVIGVPHDRWGETPKAMVVRAGTEQGAALTESDVISHCRRLLAGYKCPTSVDWFAVLPRNPSGKLLKKDLRAPYWEGRSRMVG
jgi:long-chain acyl-CoA synthetase